MIDEDISIFSNRSVRTIFQNWALFGNAKKKDPEWVFGSFTKEIEQLTIGFLKGLHDLGSELFEKGIASLQLYPSKSAQTTGFWGDELFIVNLKGSFFLIISDPTTTIKLIDKVEIPVDLDYQIRSVLVGQATAQYASMSTNFDSRGIKFIDRLFNTALNEVLSRKQQEELNVYVSKGACSFSGLDSTQCLVFHYLVRKHFDFFYRRGIYSSYISNPWSLIQDVNGVPIYLACNVPKNSAMLSAFLSLINTYTLNTLNSRIKNIVFGDSINFTSIDIIHNSDYTKFMSISSPIKLFTNQEFLNKYSAIDESLLTEFNPNLANYLALNISEDNYQNLQHRSLNELMQTIGGPKM